MKSKRCLPCLRLYTSSNDYLMEWTMIGAVVIVVVGLILTLHFVLLTTNRNFEHIIHMLDESEGHGHTKQDLVMMVIGSCIMSFAGITGYTAVHKESAQSMAGYFGLTTVLGVYFLWAAGYGLTLDTTLAPVLNHQVKEFCNGSTHSLYQHVLGCNYSAGRLHRREAIESAKGGCSLTCLDRVDLLQRMGGSGGGCQFLEDLCEDFVYSYVGTGRCLVASSVGPVNAPMLKSHGAPRGIVYLNATKRVATVVDTSEDSTMNISTGASASEHCCKWACNMAPTCAGYSFDYEDSVCYLVSGRPPAASELNPNSLCSSYHWTPVKDTVLPGLDLNALSVVAGDGHIGSKCFKKDMHLVMMQSIKNNGYWLAVGSLVAFLSLLAATTCACLLQYTMTTKRQGRKGGIALLTKMLCPCLGVSRQSKGIQIDSDDSDSDYSSSSMDTGRRPRLPRRH